MITTHGCPTCTCEMPSGPRRRSTWQLPTPESAPRVWPAWHAASELLMSLAWVSRTDLIDAMTAASDIVAKTAANTLRGAENAGLIFAKRGGGGSLWYSMSPTPRPRDELDAEIDRAMAEDLAGAE